MSRLVCLLLSASCLVSLPGCLPSAPLRTATPSPEAAEGPCPEPVKGLPTLSPSAALPPPERAPVLRPEYVTEAGSLPDATRYDIGLIVDLDTATVVGRERVSYTNTEDVPLDSLCLRLFPNSPSYGGVMTTANALLDGQRVVPAVELEGSALFLALDPPLDPGAGLDLTLDFTLTVPSEVDRGAEPTALSQGQGPTGLPKGYRQLGYYEGVLALANAYAIIPAYDDEGWNVELAAVYGDAVYSDSAFYTVRLTAPAEMTLIASGTCYAPDPAGDESNCWTCFAGPMRDFNAILGSDYAAKGRVVEGVAVNSFFYAGDDRGGGRALDYAAEAVRLFSTRFGPYPFTELDVVETPTSAGGIEYPGLVVINSSYYEAPSDRMEWVVVHEVGHQWWYSLVGNDQVDEPWLDEALTQYSTLLYFEARYGAELAAELLEQVFRRPYEELVETGRDAPVGLPVAAYREEDYGPVVYRKGPLYFHALRQEVGDESFWEILRTYLAHNRYRVAKPRDWLAAVEAVTGSEHRALYERWIEAATQ